MRVIVSLLVASATFSIFGYEEQERIIEDVKGFHVSINGHDTNNNIDIRLLNESEEWRSTKFILELTDKYGRIASEFVTVKATLSPGDSKNCLLFPLPGGFEKGGITKQVSIKKVYGFKEPDNRFVVLTREQVAELENYAKLKKKMLKALGDGKINGFSDEKIMEQNKFLLFELRQVLESNSLSR